MKKTEKLLPLLIVLFLVNGCIKYTYSVHRVLPELVSTGKGTVAVASHDQRSYVISGEYKPQTLGVIRSVGPPFPMITATGRPLADEMGDAIAGALKKNGFTPVPVITAPSDPVEEVKKKLTDTKADRLVHFKILQWRTDTYNNIRMEYNFHITVMDAAGNVLAEKESIGDDNLGWGSGFNPVGVTRKKVPSALKLKLEELLNAPDIAKALAS